MKKIFLLLIVMLAVYRLPAQVTTAPLSLFITGSGKIVPFQDGQMLDVGRKYVMTAVADPGYQFSSWQPVNIFTDIEYTKDPFGNIVESANSITVPTPDYINDHALTFTMEPIVVLFDVPNVRILTQSPGWQANFAPRSSHSDFPIHNPHPTLK